jgi:hypothetical protein
MATVGEDLRRRWAVVRVGILVSSCKPGTSAEDEKGPVRSRRGLEDGWFA